LFDELPVCVRSFSVGSHSPNHRSDGQKKTVGWLMLGDTTSAAGSRLLPQALSALLSCPTSPVTQASVSGATRPQQKCMWHWPRCCLPLVQASGIGALEMSQDGRCTLFRALFALACATVLRKTTAMAIWMRLRELAR
jgi:hypothetical protein